MSKDLNQCNFIGRLGKDPEIKYMPSGGAVANLSIACSDDYKDKQSGEKVERTEWINIVAFNKLAEIIGQYCKKGSRVFVTGSMRTRKWQGQDGQDKYTTEVVVKEMQMLDSKRSDTSSPRQQTTSQPSPAQSSMIDDDFDDDIPF